MSYRQDLKYITSVYMRITADPTCEFSAADYEAWRIAFNRAIAVHNKRTRILKVILPLLYGLLIGFYSVQCLLSAYRHELVGVVLCSLAAALNFYFFLEARNTIGKLQILSEAPPHEIQP